MSLKTQYISDIKAGDNIEDFYMVKSFSVKTASNNKKYFDFVLYDKSGEISAKLWDITDENESYNEGQIIKVRGTVSEWNGTNQIKIVKVRISTSEDGCDPQDYIKTAPEDAEEMYGFIYQYAEKIADKDLRALSTKLLKDYEAKLKYYPAAMKNHHAVRSGLLYHIKRMLLMAENMCLVYTNLKKDYLICGVILHDIAKLFEMDANEYGVVSDYTIEGHLLGHIIQGIKIVEKEGEALGIDREKILLIEHMILSHHNEPEFGSPKRPMFPEAEMLHYLDQIDARIYDMDEALRGVEPGDLTDRVWTMHNRKLYKIKEENK